MKKIIFIFFLGAGCSYFYMANDDFRKSVDKFYEVNKKIVIDFIEKQEEKKE